MGSFGNITQAVIYCRVSSDRQVREGNGLGGQESRCRGFAKQAGFEIIEVFKEAGISGGSTDRPAFFDMLNFIKPKKERIIVIIDDLNRLARDVTIHRQFKVLIVKNGGMLQCVNMQLEDTPEGQFVETIVAATAELEKEQNTRRVKARQKARLEAGYWVFMQPVGYKYVDDPIHKKLLVPDLPNSIYIRDAYTKFASDELLTQKDVQHYLRSTGLKNSRGKDMDLWLESVKRLFINPIYAGYIEYPKWSITRRQGVHEGIVSPEIFDEVNKKLSSKRKYFKGGLEKDFPLRGVLICSGCGSKMTASWTTGRNDRFPYYRCPNSKNCTVKPKSIRREHVEDDFSKLLKSKKLNEGVLKLARKVTEEVFSKKKLDFQSVVETDKRKLEKLEQEIESIVQKIVQCSNPIVISSLEKRISELADKMSILELKVARSVDFPVELNTSIDRALDFIGNPAHYWQEGDLNQKRLVQSLVFTDAIEYSKNEGFGTANFSLPFKLLRETNGPNSNLVEVAGVEPASASLTSLVLHAYPSLLI